MYTSLAVEDAKHVLIMIWCVYVKAYYSKTSMARTPMAQEILLIAQANKYLGTFK